MNKEEVNKTAQVIFEKLREIEPWLLILTVEMKPASNPAEYHFYEMLRRIAQLK